MIPTSRGIYITAHLFIDKDIKLSDVKNAYEDFYKDSKFVRLRTSAPHLNQVLGSNFCDISITLRGRTLVLNAATDNLIKGMCGTAIQNLNLISGFEESLGLLNSAMGPV